MNVIANRWYECYCKQVTRMFLLTGDINITANRWHKCYCKQVTWMLLQTSDSNVTADRWHQISKQQGLHAICHSPMVWGQDQECKFSSPCSTQSVKRSTSLSLSLCVITCPSCWQTACKIFHHPFFFSWQKQRLSSQRNHCILWQTMKKAAVWVTRRQWKRLWHEWPTDNEKGCGVSDPQMMKKAAVWVTHRQWKRLQCEWPTDNEKGCGVSDPQTMKTVSYTHLTLPTMAVV